MARTGQHPLDETLEDAAPAGPEDDGEEEYSPEEDAPEEDDN